MSYNWQLPDWPEFTYDTDRVEEALYVFAEYQGKMTGLMKALPENAQMDTVIDMMVAEAVKTSEIEGEYISRQDVLSSIRNKLGLNQALETIRDRRAKGISNLIIDVRKSYAAPLTQNKLFKWHTMPFAHTGEAGTGAWRSHEEPMQVVSGPLGKERVHFEAPPSKLVPAEMKQFISWFNETAPGGRLAIKKAPVRAAIVHLYFESIHPFEDGNGRIGRALAEKALSQCVGRPVLFSLSSALEARKKAYYQALEAAQESNEITMWLVYFVNVVLEAQKHAEKQLDFILNKAKFFDHFRNLLNERQTRIIQRMFEEGPHGFEGGINVRKYIAITKTSKATATRDLQNLVELDAFKIIGRGRSTRYQIAFFT